MSGNLAATLAMARETEAQPEAKTLRPAKMPVEKPEPAPKQQGRAGKSSNPAYEKVGILVLKNLRKKTERHFADTDGGDFSDLINRLLDQYAKRLSE